ncbi:MAG: JAB domain-containing protein [Reichenbachiella sp.]|uniref:JAB domain-containing protein n=1 Tax=Reichenbachiella sp. TaxID=2184521 RepID=UPI003264FE82
MNVRLAKDQKIKVLNTQDIWQVMQQVLLRENKIRRNQEHFWIVGLDNSQKILFIELIGLGAVNRVNANPPDVFRMGIYKLAVRMILVHNHPSGTLELSNDDLNFTDRMIKVGQLINIEVIDYLVITEERYKSFADEGLIEQLRKSGLYQIVDREKAELQQWKLDLERKKAVQESHLEIAKKMKADGIDIDTIKKYTGLKKWDIKGL